jgi:hypothetical protein
MIFALTAIDLANHFIRETTTNSILFMGKMADPLAN